VAVAWRLLASQVGGYDLICLDRDVDPSFEAVDANGHSIGDACFASGWFDYLYGTVINFINVTGLAMLETDGGSCRRPLCIVARCCACDDCVAVV
jgi:hypothetical protein